MARRLGRAREASATATATAAWEGEFFGSGLRRDLERKKSETGEREMSWRWRLLRLERLLPLFSYWEEGRVTAME